MQEQQTPGIQTEPSLNPNRPGKTDDLQLYQRLVWNLMVEKERQHRQCSNRLYESVGQDLAALLIELHLLEDCLPAGMDIAGFHVSKAISQATRAMEGTREIAQSLRPSVLDDLGPRAAVEELCLRYNQEQKQYIHFVGEEITGLNEPAKTILYRLAERCLILFDGQLQRVELQRAMQNDWAALSFELSRSINAHLPSPGSRHFFELREQVRLGGGWLELASSDGFISKLTAYFPVSNY